MERDRTLFLFLRARGGGLTALLVGACLIFLASPRVGVAYVSLSAPLAIFDLEQGRALSTEESLAAESDLKSALAFGVETATLNSQLSLLSLERLQSNGIASAERGELLTARATVESALELRPLDTYLWTRYVHLSYLLEGMSPNTLAALERSFLYGSNEPELVQFRITLCIQEWENIPPSLREEALDQIEFGAAMTNLWGRVLADLSDPAAERLVEFLRETSADTEGALHKASYIRRLRADQKLALP